MDHDRVRVGVLGAGFISDYHVAGLQAAGADVVALFSRSAETARAKVDRFGIPTVTTDQAEFFARRDVDAVVVATPDFTHEALAVAALERGKAVLVQKPMARTVAEGRRMIAAAEASGGLLCVSFMHRHFAEVEALRPLLAAGALGEVFAVRQRNATPGSDWAEWYYRRENVGGGVVMQLGVHGIDLLRLLFGEIVAVQATTATVRRERTLADGTTVVSDNEDLALATYRFASGLLASHEMTNAEMAGTDRFRLEVYGTAGTAWLRSERGRLALYAPDNLGRSDWVVPELPPDAFGERQHRRFLAMVRGEAPPDGSARDGLCSLLVAAAIYRSAASGRWEEVEPA
jgi:myo-inositol 2-dehydrogenase/D-chiro-inositol 1-dehydrogenase